MTVYELKTLSSKYKGKSINSWLNGKLGISSTFLLSVIYIMNGFLLKGINGYFKLSLIASGILLFIMTFYKMMRIRKIINDQKTRIVEILKYKDGIPNEKIEIGHQIEDKRVTYFIKNDGYKEVEYSFNVYENEFVISNLSTRTKEHQYLSDMTFKLIQVYHEENFDRIVKPIIERKFQKAKQMYEQYQS